MAFEKEMQALVQAERARVAMGPVSDMVAGGLSIEDAHFICEQNIQARLNAGEVLKGYKVGFTNIPVRDNMGLPDSTYGYLMDNMILESGGELQMSELIAPKVECEICFKIKDRIMGLGVTIEQVIESTEAVSAAFEICDARIKDWKCPYPDFFADNGFSARIIVPGVWKPVDEVDLLNETVVLTEDGKKLAEGKGEMAMEHTANAVVWLANKLAQRKKGIMPGQVVMTGTLTPILPIKKGSTYVAAFSTLGTVEKTFV